jgi:hypothetical protein
MVNKHITDKLPYRLSRVAGGSFNTSGYGYDVAINNQPYFIANNTDRPYRRITAKYRKDQVDQTTEPGEQTLTGWWLRSQTSFHNGAGINYYEPSQDETIRYRYTDSKGMDVWKQGEAKLLRESTPIGFTPTTLESNGRAVQLFNSIEWLDGTIKKEGFLYVDSYIMAKVDEAGTIESFQTYDPAVNDRIYAACNDGNTAFWITNAVSGGLKLTAYKKSLNDDSGDSPTQMFQVNGTVVTNAVMEFTKERIVAAINNRIYEFASTATALPTAVYTHPDTNHTWSSITSSGAAIYVAGYNGIQSSIVKFTLSTAGVMPTLTSAITAAELPVGEIVQKIKYYLGYMLIGTSKGVRIAVVSDEDGSINYGPLLFETKQPVYDFAVRDRFAWCASGNLDGDPGLVRIDLGNPIGTLVFPYANDLYVPNGSATPTVACDFIGNTNRLAWVTAAGAVNTIINKALTSNVATLTTGSNHSYKIGDKVFITGVGAPFNSSLAIGSEKTITAVTSNTFSFAETNANISSAAVSPAGKVIKAGVGYEEEPDELIPTGFITTGRIRYNTLEPKVYKFLWPRVDLTNGSMSINSIDPAGNDVLIRTSPEGEVVVEGAVTAPDLSAEYISLKFTFNRNPIDTELGPLFDGWQLKALPATKRTRLIQYPVLAFDHEEDKLNNKIGYEGRAYERIKDLEAIEELGDTVQVIDYRTGESFTATIEELDFSNTTPPDERFENFGGILLITVRTV